MTKLEEALDATNELIRIYKLRLEFAEKMKTDLEIQIKKGNK